MDNKQEIKNIYKTSEAMRRAQKTYYEKNRLYIINRNSTIYAPRYGKIDGKASYKKIKENPEQLKRLKEYHRLRYIKMKEQKERRETGTESE